MPAARRETGGGVARLSPVLARRAHRINRIMKLRAVLVACAQLETGTGRPLEETKMKL